MKVRGPFSYTQVIIYCKIWGFQNLRMAMGFLAPTSAAYVTNYKVHILLPFNTLTNAIPQQLTLQ